MPDTTTRPDRYRWTALSNTTLGIFMATLDSSIVLISLPAIFRGIGLDPLTPSNIGYLLWMLMGYLVVTAVLVVTFGRLGDIFGRVRMYNAGFAVFLVMILVGITSGLPPAGGHTMGWTSPWVLFALVGAVALLVAFPVIETRTTDPMFDVTLFRIRAFTAGNAAGLLASIGRGG